MKSKFVQQRTRKLVAAIIAVLVIMGISQQTVHADNKNNFSIQTLNQDGTVNQQGFYHLIGHPGEKQTIALKVYNASEEEITIKAAVNPASTNKNGIPNYMGEEQYDSSLKYRMDELVSIEETKVKVPASGSVTVNATVIFPDKEWEGDVLGGIRITEEAEQNSEQTVVHEVAYTVGILLNQTNGVSVENELHLQKVSAGQRNYRTYIEANVQNSAAAIIREMNVQAKIIEKNSETPIYTYDAYELRMAPNSNFDFGIPTGDQPIKAGDYLLDMIIQADGKEYQFQKNFTIGGSEARQLNQSSVNIVKTSNAFPANLVITGLVLVGLILFVSGYLHKRKNRSLTQ
ncbi:hypothetical protein D920_02843 [Enterococcus faecalis 13-SD-W-01]|nr:hypothetical protein D920_02843 [Enterococcus faecalis 13-SD-W-01]